MKLIVGLGNPGERYTNSRHNVGFMVVEELARQFSIFNFQFSMSKNLKAETLKVKVRNEELILIKPQTFMNECGWTAEKILRYYDIKILSDLWVVHDDLDLPLGKIKIRVGGGTAGHHGLESIVKQLGTTDFVRFRLGIGHPARSGKWEVGGGKLVSENVGHREVEKYVLSGFSGKETVEANKMIKKAVGSIEFALESSLEAAMNKFNAR